MWWSQQTRFGAIGVALGPKGIERISLPVDFQKTREAQPPVGYSLGRDDRVAAAIQAWCDGDASEAQAALADLTPYLPASSLPDFYNEVLATLAREVHWGEIVTYGELAALSGKPRAARAVGAAMAANPIPFVIPCHRVARSAGNGRRSLGGYGGGHDEKSLSIKRILLEREGVLLPD
ncbi:MAG: methylated-DNA--[protein]-cysteine S-methyltransferase [Acidimicrobiia bacterium]|nr:methylated-DNA--[protein]-cysteine S-methyltransferase [Acidimicrobiia bacterium]MBJ7381749.1 methylated-DNA--[protein]-cysteine S-methyltransferase [Acidimicrobiia bacterium]